MAEGFTSARATRVNELRVELSTTPITSGKHDALNPKNWAVELATGGSPLEVTEVTADATSTRVFYLRVLPSMTGGVAWRVKSATAPGLRASDGTTQYSTPSSVTARAPLYRATARSKALRGAELDFALPMLAPNGKRGRVYQVDANGDYALTTEAEARPSHYLRRMQTPRGGFAWAPDYGVGLQPKRLFSAANLLAARREVALQLAKEPGVRSVAPRITQESGSVVHVHVAVDHVAGPVEVAQTLES